MLSWSPISFSKIRVNRMDLTSFLKIDFFMKISYNKENSDVQTSIKIEFLG